MDYICTNAWSLGSTRHKLFEQYLFTYSSALGDDFGTPALVDGLQELCGMFGELYAIRLDLIELTIKDIAKSAIPVMTSAVNTVSKHVLLTCMYTSFYLLNIYLVPICISGKDAVLAGVKIENPSR